MPAGFPGTFTRKAADKANGKLKALGRTMDRLRKDEGGSASRGEVPVGEINHPTNQGGSAMYGRRMSQGASVAGGERQVHRDHIDKAANARQFPAGSGISAANRNQRNTRAKGPIAPQGGQYGGGGRNTQ